MRGAFSALAGQLLQPASRAGTESDFDAALGAGGFQMARRAREQALHAVQHQRLQAGFVQLVAGFADFGVAASGMVHVRAHEGVHEGGQRRAVDVGQHLVSEARRPMALAATRHSTARLSMPWS